MKDSQDKYDPIQKRSYYKDTIEIFREITSSSHFPRIAGSENRQPLLFDKISPIIPWFSLEYAKPIAMLFHLFLDILNDE